MTGTSRSKKILIGSVVVVALLIVLVAIAPMLLSLGPAATIVRSVLAPHVEGEVSIESVRTRWFAEQRVTGLTITEPNGREAAALDATLHHGLFRTLFMRPAMLDVSLIGMAHGEVREDGTLSFQDLIKTEPKPDEPFNLKGVPGLRVALDHSSVELLIAATNDILLLRDTHGILSYRPGHPISLQFGSATESVGTTGSLHATAEARDIFDTEGRFTPRGAVVDSKIELTSLPLRAGEYDGMLHELTVTAHAADLAELLQLSVEADGTVRQVAGADDLDHNAMQPDADASHLEGKIELASLFTDEGMVTFDMEHLSGNALGHRVPSGLFQPIFAATPVRISRDAGPVVDVDADFVAGPQIRTDLHVKGDDAELEIRATMNREDGSWDGEYLKLTMPRAHPRLIEDYTTLIPDRPVDMEIELTQFRLPPLDPERNRRRLPDYGATGYLRVHQPVELTIPNAVEAGSEDESEDEDAAPALTVNLEALDMNFESPRLRNWLDLNGNAQADGGSLTLEQRLTNLFDEEDEIALEQLFAEGTLIAENWPIAPVARFIPDYEALALESLGEQVTIDLETSRISDSLRAAIELSSPQTTLNLVALRHVDSLELDEGSIAATITPRAVTLLPLDAELPATLVRDAPVRINLIEPVVFPRTGPLEYDWMPDRLVAHVESDEVAVDNVTGLREAAALRSLSANVTASRAGTWTIDADGEVDVFRLEGEHRVMHAVFDVSSRYVEPPERDQPFYATTYSLHASNVAIEHLEALSEWGGAEWAMLAGETGTFTISGTTEFETQQVTVDMDFDRLRGQVEADLDQQRVNLDSSGVELTVAAAWLESFLNQTDRQTNEPAGGLPGRVTLTDDVLLTLTRAQFNLPRKTNPNGNASFAFHEASIDAEVTANRLATRIAGEHRSRLSDISLTLNGESIGRQLDFDLRADSRSRIRGTDESGRVDLVGNVENLLDEDGSFLWETALLTFTEGTIEHAPTVIADALLNARGYLVATVGSAMSSTVVANRFSGHSGTLDLDIRTTYGWLTAHGEGRDGTIMVTTAQPLQAELEINPLMRERLLPMIHPLLGDILSSENPLALDINSATVPLDADISRLNAEIRLELGNVELDSRSRLFTVLALAQEAAGRPLTGSFDPIVAHIRDGVLSYDEFIASVAGIDLAYEGRINLADRSVELRTTVPFTAVATQALPRDVRDLPIGRFSDVLEDVSVPIITTGRIGELQTRADPEIDLGSIVQRIIRDALRGDDDDRPFPFPFPPR